jgi:tyrosine-protein phosphatase SIW14
METNGIKHIVIDVQSTKKVNIPLAVMKSVMEVALDRRNYPMLMHCNHGKVKQDPLLTFPLYS